MELVWSERETCLADARGYNPERARHHGKGEVKEPARTMAMERSIACPNLLLQDRREATFPESADRRVFALPGPPQERGIPLAGLSAPVQARERHRWAGTGASSSWKHQTRPGSRHGPKTTGPLKL